MKKYVVSILAGLFIWSASGDVQAVYSCGGINDTCQCGANNPYPCCDNGGNCTWYAWHSACCNWGMALPGWGNANTWGQYATANPNYEVLNYPVVGSIANRTIGTYGHVAFVVDVSGSTITVEEENCCSTCGAGMRTWTYDASYFDGGFIIPQGGITPPACSIEIDGQPRIIDDQDDCYEYHGQYWWDEATGNDNHAYYTYATDDPQPDSWAAWRFNVTVAGNYEVSVFVPSSANELAQDTFYTITHAGGETTIPVNQATSANSWVSLGEFYLNTGTEQFLKLTDNTGESYDLRRVIMFDAVSVDPVVQCSDECDTDGAVTCDGTSGYKTCGNFDGDDCLEWSTVTYCGLDEVCNGGNCEPDSQGCSDECTIEGRSCATDTAYVICGNFDEDSCLELDSITECGENEHCDMGNCVIDDDGGFIIGDIGNPNDASPVEGGSGGDTGCSCKSAGEHSTPRSWPVFILLLIGLLPILRKQVTR